MTNLTQKFSQSVFGAATRLIILTLFLMVFGTNAVLAQTRGYVTNFTNNTVSVVNTATNTVVATVPVLGGPYGVAVTPNHAFVYVANFAFNNVQVISTALNAVVATIPVGLGPEGIAITPSGAFAYVANSNSNNVQVISTTTNTVVATIPG